MENNFDYEKLTRIVTEKYGESLNNDAFDGDITDLDETLNQMSNDLYSMLKKETGGDKITLGFRNESTNQDPEYIYEGDSGFDLRAKVKDLKEQLHDSEYASHFANQCKNTWYSNKVMSIPEEKKKFVQSQLPRIKENLLNNFITPLSNESREETENYLNNLSHHFGTDPKPNDDDSDPVTSIKEYLSSYDDNQYEILVN